MDDRLTHLPEGVSAVLYRYRLPLAAALPGTGALSDREGILLRLRDATGREGWGEAAPLPGFSGESINQVVNAARWWRRGELSTGPPTLAFAVDSALLDLVSQEHGKTTVDYLGPHREHIDVNALLSGDEDLDDAAQRFRRRGVQVVKVKVGRKRIDEDAERVHRLRAMLPGDVSLRLDANRAWRLSEAKAFFRALGGTPIEYIEEPLIEPDLLAELAHQLNVPIALDETTREMQPEALADLPWCHAIVLKPSLLGSLARYRAWVDAARNGRIRVVLSGAFESGVALQMLIALAAALPEPSACGFAPYGRLAEDVLHPRIDVASARIDVRDATTRRTVRYEALAEVTAA